MKPLGSYRYKLPNKAKFLYNRYTILNTYFNNRDQIKTLFLLWLS